MAFNDLQLKVAAESGVIAAHKNLAKLSLFAKSFNELEGAYGASIAVPVYDFDAAAAFVAGSNDYGTGSNEIDGALVNLDKHYVKSTVITDRNLAETGINWVKDTAGCQADALTRAINALVFGSLTSEIEVEIDLSSKTAIAGLYKAAAENDIPVDRAVVVLCPSEFAKVLAQLDASAYGGTEAIRLGVIPGIYGFKGMVCSSNLAEGVLGLIVADNAVGIASRYLAPGTEGAYPETWKVTDEDGFTIGYRRFMDLSKGYDILAADALFGFKVLQADKIVKLVAPEE